METKNRALDYSIEKGLMMKTLFYFLFALALSLTGMWAHAQNASVKEAALLAQDPVVEKRLILISKELRCLVCQNESLADSHAELALDLRQEIRELIQAGKTDAQIRQFMVDRYGDFVLYRPVFESSTFLLWLGPLFFGVLGVGGLLWYIFRRLPFYQEAADLDQKNTGNHKGNHKDTEA